MPSKNKTEIGRLKIFLKNEKKRSEIVDKHGFRVIFLHQVTGVLTQASAEIIPDEPDKVMLEGEWNRVFLQFVCIVPAVIIAGYFFAKKYRSKLWRKPKMEEILQYVSFGIIVLCAVGILLFATLGKKKAQTRELVFAASCIALSFVLSFVKVKVGANGGSVTLASFVPIFIFSYVYGVRKGLLVGTIYGIMQIVEGGVYFVNVIQLLADYILAFASVGLASVFKKMSKDAKWGVYAGIVLVVFTRFLMHTVAGIYYYEGMAFFDALIASVLYNGAYMLPELVITTGVVAVLVQSGNFTYLAQTLKGKNTEK